MLIKGVNVFKYGNSSFKLKNGIIIYINPHGVYDEDKADLILITHGDYGNLSLVDIERLSYEKTVIITTETCAERLSGNVKVVKPGDVLNVLGIRIIVTHAYNTDVERRFHVKGHGLGFVLELGEKRIYFAGDTDFIPEMREIGRLDIAFLPVGGEDVMNYEEAAEVSNMLKAEYVVPFHYDHHSDAGIDFKHMVVNSKVVLL